MALRSLRRLASDLARKVARDRSLPLGALARKGARYAIDLATAPLYLRRVDALGRRARTYARPVVDNRGSIEVGDDVLVRSVNAPVHLYAAAGGRLVIGSGVRLNYGATLAAAREVRLGDRVRVGPYAWIADAERPPGLLHEGAAGARAVVIEDDVWIGAKASVMPGVTIGRGAIVGTSAVVVRDVAPFSVVAGAPARVIGHLDESRFEVEGRDR